MMPRCADSCARAVFVCAADDPYDKGGKNRKLLFKTGGAKIRVIGRDQDMEPVIHDDGIAEVPIVSNEAVLMIAE
jgi:hypothetical protein